MRTKEHKKNMKHALALTIIIKRSRGSFFLVPVSIPVTVPSTNFGPWPRKHWPFLRANGMLARHTKSESSLNPFSTGKVSRLVRLVLNMAYVW